MLLRLGLPRHIRIQHSYPLLNVRLMLTDLADNSVTRRVDTGTFPTSAPNNPFRIATRSAADSIRSSVAWATADELGEARARQRHPAGSGRTA